MFYQVIGTRYACFYGNCLVIIRLINKFAGVVSINTWETYNQKQYKKS